MLDLAAAAGMSEVLVVSACLGQNSMPPEAAEKLCASLDLDTGIAVALQRPPKKGGPAEIVSQDPLIYRLFEIAHVYGDTIKELIHERFGDGIMSAIDFDLAIDQVEHPTGIGSSSP